MTFDNVDELQQYVKESMAKNNNKLGSLQMSPGFRPPPFVAQKPCRKFDVGIILDSSYSVRLSYDATKDFVKKLASEVDTRINKTQLALIHFSDWIDHNLKFKDYNGIEDFNKAVDKLEKIDSITRIDAALRMAQQQMFSVENGARKNARKLIILLSDGSQTHGYGNPINIAHEMKASGIEIIGVAVGQDFNQTIMQGIVGEGKEIFYSESYQEAVKDEGTHTDYGIIRRVTKYMGECVTEPDVKPFTCYNWNSLEQAMVGQRSDSAQKKYCESALGYRWTSGNDSQAPGCGTCKCCKPTTGISLSAFKEMAGDWNISFAKLALPGTVSREGMITVYVGDNETRSSMAMRSDNEKDFPSERGWYMTKSLLRDGTWEYFRLRPAGQSMQVHHFCTFDDDDCKATFGSSENYCCLGEGTRIIMAERLKELAGDWQVSFPGSNYKITIEEDGTMLADKSSTDMFAEQADDDDDDDDDDRRPKIGTLLDSLSNLPNFPSGFESITNLFKLQKKQKEFPRRSQIVPSDNQVEFPADQGWYMVKNLLGEGTWDYFKMGFDGVLNFEHFCNTCQGTYKTISSYGYAGSGEKIIPEVLSPTRVASIAIAVIKDQNLDGAVKFMPDIANNCMKVRVVFKKIPSGEKTIALHEAGDFRVNCKGAGQRFRYARNKSGLLGNVVPKGDGTASLNVCLENLQASGDFSILGRSVVLEERRSAERIGCGVIGHPYNP